MKDQKNFKRLKDNIVHFFEKYNIERKFRITYDIVANIGLFFVITALLVGIFTGGVGAGYFASLVKDEPIRPYEEMTKDIYNYEETSKLYFADNIYIGDIRSDLHREEITLDEVSELVKQAVIATEDELFYEHQGVVPKAILRALIQEVTNAEQKTGGSTLTQQLIKNQILTNEVSFERKAKEILLALRLENFFEKDEILEAYLNIVPFGREASGRNIAGIQTAAQGVFGIDASELNLPQAAFLAGLPQNPYTYTPFTSTGEVKDEEGLSYGINRMKTVLLRMYQTGIIDEKEYKEALEYDIVADFTKKSISPIEEYPAIVFELEKRATEILKVILAEEDGYTKEELEEDEQLNEQYTILADRALRRNGYHIHSTINKKMYDKMQEIVSEYEYFGPDRTVTKDGETKTEPVENGMVLIENKTGKILSFVPGRDFRAGDREFNFAFQATRSPGSTFKPLVYAAGFELGKLQPGSVFADIPVSYGSYSPKNYGGAYYGLVTLREALTYSYNVTAVKAYYEIMNDNPIDLFYSKMGYKSISSTEEAGNISFAIGGMDHGVTVEENTGGFATLANGGLFNETYMIEKITDNDGNVVYEHKTEPVEVFSPQTAYLTIDMMRDVVRSGTAAYLQSQLRHGGVDWAGKTGTSNDYKDAWFIGTNPNVTMGSWIGYETPASVYCANCSLSYHQRNIKLWAQVVNSLTDDFPELMAPKERFARPDGIVSRSFCATSGLIPSKLCQDAGLVKSDLFNAKFVPTKEDDSLIGGDMPLVMIDGEQVVAGPNTPEEFTLESRGGITFNPEFLKRMKYDQLSDLSVLIPRRNRDNWEKIGFSGIVDSYGEIDASEASAPQAPGGLEASKNRVKWNHHKGQLIVGYRIYYAEDQGKSFRLIGHTTDTSYQLPDEPGYYHIRAVNYFGQESNPSANIIIEIKDEEPKDKDDEKKQKQKPPKKKDDQKQNKPEPEEPRDEDENNNNNNDDVEDPDEDS